MSDKQPNESWRAHSLLQARNLDTSFQSAPWEENSELMPVDRFRPWLSSDPDSVEEVDAVPKIQPIEPSDQTAADEENSLEEIAAFDRQDIEQQKRALFEEGFERGTDIAEQRFEAVKAQFVELIDRIKIAQEDMTAFYDPLKKLAVHLAEQVIRGELTASSVAIERLIKEALADLSQQNTGQIIINLNTKDYRELPVTLSAEFPQIDFRADETVSRGSLILRMGDSVVEDFLEHRLQTLADEILQFRAPGKPGSIAQPSSDSGKSDLDVLLEPAPSNIAGNDIADYTKDSQPDA